MVYTIVTLHCGMQISPQLGLHQGSMGSVESGASLDSRPVPKRASSASSTASNWPAHAGGTLHHGKGPLATHAHMNGAGGMHPMAPPNRAPSPVPSGTALYKLLIWWTQIVKMLKGQQTFACHHLTCETVHALFLRL